LFLICASNYDIKYWNEFNRKCPVALCSCFFITSLQADTVIAPFSDSAAMMLRELLIKLTKHANEHDKTASTRNADLPQSTSRCNELQELTHESHLQVQVGLGSRSTVSVSLDNLSTPSDLGHSLQKDKVRCKIIMSM
jgi:hypothetical protein